MDAITHLFSIHVHSSNSSRGSARKHAGLRRAAVALLALVATITLVGRLETALNPAAPVGVPTPTQTSPTPGFDG
jgi:hypothetical protein